jgi:16S rRNA (cytosine967-C5)-methyltransferase
MRRDLDPVRAEARAVGFIAKAVLDAVLHGRPADRELARHMRELGRVHPRLARLIPRAVFALFRWWGWTRDLAERDVPLALLASYLLDSGPYHPVTTDWARRYDWIKGASLTPPPAAAALDDRAAWLRAFVNEPKRRFNPLALVPAWFFSAVDLPGHAFERALLEALQRPAPLWIRRRDDAPLDGLALDPHAAVPLAAKAASADSLYLHPAFKKGLFEIQDLASQAVSLACAPSPGSRWWDACAGGGGKTLHLASLLKGKGTVLATDVKAHKLDETRRRAARARLHNVVARAWDGRRTPGAFDGVLVDAPCSGVGTWRRNPDARWRTGERDVAELAAKQRDILARAAEGVKPGGVLVHAVCTLTRAETGGVVDAFLAEHGGFRLDPAPHPLTGAATDGRIWIWPHEHDCDGMFIARMARRG